jgi:hypothetical protein
VDADGVGFDALITFDLDFVDDLPLGKRHAGLKEPGRCQHQREAAQHAWSARLGFCRRHLEGTKKERGPP